MDVFHIITLAIGLAVGIALGIWWTRHSYRNHPEKVEALVREAKATRDKVRDEYERQFGDKP